jgi:hypothetical protein
MRQTNTNCYRKYYDPEGQAFDDGAKCRGVSGCDLCKGCVHYLPGPRTPAHFLEVPMKEPGKCRCYKGVDERPKERKG